MEIVKSDDLQERIVFNSMLRNQKDKLSNVMNESQNLTADKNECTAHAHQSSAQHGGLLNSVPVLRAEILYCYV